MVSCHLSVSRRDGLRSTYSERTTAENLEVLGCCSDDDLVELEAVTMASDLEVCEFTGDGEAEG